MTLDFFEGAAGTGKTHSLVSHAAELVREGVLGEDRRVLALTFMNGARRRLQARLGQNLIFRGRFECQTFDVFARVLAARRRSLFSGNARIQEQAAALDEFDGPCFLAGSVLEMPDVQKWTGASFPLVLIDEAQDLDDHRMHIVQGLSASSRIVAAADAFQCLTDGQDTTGVMRWLEAAGQTHRLTQPRRTAQRGLLAAARAVREGLDLAAALTRSQRALRGTWYGQGFRLVESFATNSGIIARTIADEMSLHVGQTAILTPDARNPMLRDALKALHTRVWSRRNGQSIGPFPFAWEMRDSEVAGTLIDELQLPPAASYADLRRVLEPVASTAPIAHTIARLDRLRRVHGQNDFTAVEVAGLIQEAVRNQSRLGFRQHRGNLAMTIQRAKNREFQNVIVLWPHTATGSAEHLRRLLYNGITRATNHCSVIVLGQGRLNSPPFTPPPVN